MTLKKVYLKDRVLVNAEVIEMKDHPHYDDCILIKEYGCDHWASIPAKEVDKIEDIGGAE